MTASKQQEGRRDFSRDDAEDGVLVAKSRGGDVDAFDALVRRHEDRLFRSLAAFLGNAEDALDAAQEAFVKAFRSISRFRGESGFYTWLYRIALNTAVSGRRRRVPVAGVSDGVWRDWAHKNPSADDDPAEQVQRAERIDAVRAAIADLDDDHRSVIVLRDIDGFSYGEIADVLGVGAGTVKSRLHRARRRLAEKLQGIVT